MTDEERGMCQENKDRRLARRRMAWIALFSIQAVTLLACFWISIERLEIIKELLSWYFTVMAGIIGAYMGISSFEHIRTKNIGVTRPQEPQE